jgi:hypothetical protein
MDYRLLDDGPIRTFVLIGEIGDDALKAINAFARDQNVSAAQITAVGAFRQATVGWFDRATKDYRRIHLDEQCELLSLVGDIALGADGSPVAHLHAVLGLCDGQVRGGHLLEGEVWPTLEVLIRDTAAHLRKTYRPELGLALIDLDRSDDPQ